MTCSRPCAGMCLLAILLLPCGACLRAGEVVVTARPEGISAEAQSKIDKGLAYLARTQNRDGSWRSAGGYGSYPTVMTALAGLALMAGGNTPLEGKYATQVRRAVDYLLRSAQRNGLITSMAEESRSMYGHGFSMLFLGEAYGMESNPELQRQIHKVLTRAVQLTARSQSKDGGWLYTPDANSDEGSVTVTQIQGLRSCRNAGIKVPKSTIDRACAYIGKCQNKDGGIAYSLASRGQSRPAITAAAVASLYNAGQYDHPVAAGALTYTKKLLEKSKGDVMTAFQGHGFYALFYVSQALWFSGDKDWQDFFPKARDQLLKTQKGDGSWDGDNLGGTFGTSIALLVLQLPHRRLPIFQR